MTTPPDDRTRLTDGLGDHQQFFDAMIAALPGIAVKLPGTPPITPLAALTERSPSDPTIALLDAWAATADIISFYQDRILNEGYLLSAVEQRSLALLGRMLGVIPGSFIAATTELALFVEPGAQKSVTVPQGTAIQASASGGTAGPVFETTQDMTALPSLNRLVPLQTTAANLSPDATGTVLEGTGLGLSAGDLLVLVRTVQTGGDTPTTQWLRMAVTRSKDNSVLGCTEISWGRTLEALWNESGTGGSPPQGLIDNETTKTHYALYALRLSCKLFGYNAPAWSTQPYATRLAATPAGHNPGQYGEWPNFDVDPETLDLQGIYSKVLPNSIQSPAPPAPPASPDSILLLEDPWNLRLGTLKTVAPMMTSAYGMSAQTTRVTLTDVHTYPTGVMLRPPRWGHTATQRPDGKVLIVGGVGADGKAMTQVDLFDPATGLLSSGPALPGPRAFHTATVAGTKLVLIGGIGDEGLAADVLSMTLTDASPAFTAGAQLPTPRVRHQTTLLPDGRLMVSGGSRDTDQLLQPIAPALLDLLPTLPATGSVTIYDPADGTFGAEAHLQKARAGHTASLYPIWHGSVLWGHAVAFVGGDASLGPHRADAEITLPWPADGSPPETAGTLVPELFPVQDSPPSTPAAARHDHRATVLPDDNGVLLTGGADADGNPLGDAWLFYGTIDLPGPVDQPGSDPVDQLGPGPVILSLPGRPVFLQAAKLRQPRSNHIAACLPGGQVMLAGGEAAGGSVDDSVEIYSLIPKQTVQQEGAAALSGPTDGVALSRAQTRGAWTVLANGRLFLSGGLGSLEPPDCLGTVGLYDPTLYTFVGRPGPLLPSPSTVAPLATVALADGTILVIGSDASAKPVAWTFDPATNLSTQTAQPKTARFGGTCTMLQNNTVLLAGGFPQSTGGSPMASAELYDPRSRSFYPIVATMSAARCGHSATMLPDGSVLLAGGDLAGTADVFSPVSQSFTKVSSGLPDPVSLHAAVVLADGNVLITGGVSGAGSVATACIFDVRAQGFAPIGPLGQARALHSATLLPDGKVLIAGGGATGQPNLNSTEVYDPATLGFADGPAMLTARCGHGAMPLDNGRILMIGGDAGGPGGVPPATGEMFAAVNLPFPPTAMVIPTALLPIPTALPPVPADITKPRSRVVQQVLLRGSGIFAFGADTTSQVPSAPGVAFILPPSPPTLEARRQTLVFTQSQPLAFARPIDTSPLGCCATPPPCTITLTGLIDDLQPASTLLIAGQPPLALISGTVTYVGGTTDDSDHSLDVGMPLMVLSGPGPNDVTKRWAVVTAKGIETSVEADGTLNFLSGNGKDIGNISPDIAAKFTRPVQGEMIGIETIVLDPDSTTTILTLTAPLRLLYDRTATTLYGNVADVSHGATVTGEVLGSGDGTVPFQAFTLRQSPLTYLLDATGRIVPQLKVFVSGVAWQRVDSLSGSAPDDRHYQLTGDAQGRAQICFGDGANGLRLPTGTDNVVATYRVGAGAAGNVPAGSLTRPPTRVAGLSGALNPLAATGGIGPLTRDEMRHQIPLGVEALDRIVSTDDFALFPLGYPDVGQAVQSLASDGTVLVTITGRDGTIPDRGSDAFQSLDNAMNQAKPRPMPHALLPATPKLFKLEADIQINPPAGTAPRAVQMTAIAAVQERYAAAAATLGAAINADDIALFLQQVSGVEKATVTFLWVQTDPKKFNHILPASEASGSDPNYTGAEILFLSADSDAVTLDEVLPS